MAFLGLGASQSNQQTDQTEVGQQVTDRASASSVVLGNVDASRGATSTVNIIDGGAVANAINFASDTNERSILAVRESANDALLFGAGAFESASDTVTEATENALEFGAGAFETGVAFIEGNVEDTINALESARIDSLEFAAGTIQETSGAIGDAYTQAILAGDRARADAYLFSAGATQEAFNATDRALEALDKSVTDVGVHYQTSQENALSFSAGALNALLEQSGDLTSDTLAIVEQTTANTLSSLADAQSKTIASIGEVTKSESAQSFDRLVKFAALTFVTIGIVFVAIKKG